MIPSLKLINDVDLIVTFDYNAFEEMIDADPGGRLVRMRMAIDRMLAKEKIRVVK
jgi:hypothetical protein